MTTTTFTPAFQAPPRRAGLGSLLTLALWLLVCGGFLASVLAAGGVPSPASRDATLAETPCPPTCVPRRG
ncbi:MAG TPA: hypothetical protein VFP50_16050 [Anaeromyxobacteraceae bacterium]|nr:hypothetical protein [Anaeromyxobacteraceae bacterium]